MGDLMNGGVPRDADISLLTDREIQGLVDSTMLVAASRPARRRSRWVVPVAAAAAGVTVLGLTVFGPAVTPAWSAAPHPLSAVDLATAEHECQTFMNVGSGARVVAAESRGDSTFVLLDDTSQCLWAFGGSMGGTNIDPGPATGDQVRVVTNNSAGGRVDGADVLPDGNPKPGAGDWIWSISGRVGPDVEAIVVHRGSAGDVVATVENGWFLAWWPGEQAGTPLTVTTAAGTREQLLPDQ